MISAIRQSYYYLRKLLEIKPLYKYNCKRFIKYSGRKDSEESFIGSLTMAVHGIEKGLTMGNFRAGFGRERLLKLLDAGEQYISQYGLRNVQIHHIANVVNDYKLCHKTLNYRLDDQLSYSIDQFLSHFNCPATSDIQLSFTRESFFSENHADFFRFSNSRHSCRNFDNTPLDVNKIISAVRLAQNSPSACNRQPVRIYVIETKERIADVLALHGGTRGFATKIDKLILVCGYLPCYHTTERDCVYTDCGIFAMNLAYSLHYYEVGACLLNWSVSNANDTKCRKIVGLPEDEVICSLIACGNVPESFKVCNSGKKDLESIIHFVK